MSMEPDKRSTFQINVDKWLHACMGANSAADVGERNVRFLEEAVELVQACGGNAEDAHTIVDYVFNRPVGDKAQEVGGVMTTLAALCNTHHIDMCEAADVEIERAWSRIDEIRAKQASKPQATQPAVGG